jgi:hypothetical protein
VLANQDSVAAAWAVGLIRAANSRSADTISRTAGRRTRSSSRSDLPDQGAKCVLMAEKRRFQAKKERNECQVDVDGAG